MITETEHTQENFAKGARVVVATMEGNRLWQERPFECRHSECKCGNNCHGVKTLHEGTSRGVVHYADNSIEAQVDCDNGRVLTVWFAAPSGDACF